MSWLRRVVGAFVSAVRYSPSREMKAAMERVDWRSVLQPPFPDGTPYGGRPYAVGITSTQATQDAERLGAIMLEAVARPLDRGAIGGLSDAPGTLNDGVTPHNTHSPEQETTTMDDDKTTNPNADYLARQAKAETDVRQFLETGDPTHLVGGSEPDNPVAPPPNPDTVEAHIVDLWERDMVHLILRGRIPGSGVVYAMARPGILHGAPYDLNQWWYTDADAPQGVQPGIALRRDDAVKAARAILATTGDTTPTEAQVADLQSVVDGLTRELAEARQAAIVAGLERDQAMTVAGAYLDHREAVEAHLADMTAVAAEHRDRVERLENPQRFITGVLDETAETWGPALNTLQVVPDWEARAHRAESRADTIQAAHDRDLRDWEDRRREGEKQVQRLMASRDNHADGRRRAEEALAEAQAEVTRLTEQLATAKAAAHQARAEQAPLAQAKLDAKVAGYADAANDLTNHAAAKAREFGSLAGHMALLDLVNGIRSHAGLPTLAEMPEPPAKRTPEGAASSPGVDNPVENGSGE